MKLPDLMIVPIFNEYVEKATDRTSFDMTVFEEEFKSKHSERLTRMDNMLPLIKEKVINLEMEVKSFKK